MKNSIDWLNVAVHPSRSCRLLTQERKIAESSNLVHKFPMIIVTRVAILRLREVKVIRPHNAQSRNACAITDDRLAVPSSTVAPTANIVATVCHDTQEAQLSPTGYGYGVCLFNDAL